MIALRYFALILLLLPIPTLGQNASQSLSRAVNFHQVNCDSAIYYTSKVLKESSATDSMVLHALFIKGWNESICGRYAESISTCKTFLSHPSADVTDKEYIRLAGRIGTAFRETGQYDSAMVYLKEYDRLVDQYISSNAIEAKLELGELYRYMDRMDLSNAVKLEAIDRARRSGNRMDLTMSLYYYLDDNVQDIGKDEYRPLLSEYLELVGKMQSDGTVDYSHAAMFLLGESNELELKSLQKDLDNIQPVNRDKGYLFLTEYLAREYLARSQSDSAAHLAQIGLTTAQGRGEKLFVQQFNKILSEISEAEGRYQDALAFNREYHRIRDSIVSAAVLQNIDSLRIRYETVLKEQQIADQALRIQKQNNLRNILIAIVAALLWFGAFITLYLLNRNRLQRQISAQEAEIRDQRIHQLEQEKQLLAMNSMIEGQEAERMRIAQDLHDGLGGLLGTIKARFSLIQEEIHALESLDVYTQVNELINTASSEVRRISHNMAPHALRLGTLKDALSDLSLQLKSDHLNVEFQWNGELVDLDQSRQVMLFRIAQELSNNVIKHAGATHLLIQVNCYPDELNVIVEDNGNGFRVSDSMIAGGLGLKSVESRVRFLNGELDIDSASGKGTTVTIQVPVRGSQQGTDNLNLTT